MEAKHGIAVTWVLETDINHHLTRLEVDAWHKHLHHTSFTGTGHYFVAVGSELLTIKVTMSIYIITTRQFTIYD